MHNFIPGDLVSFDILVNGSALSDTIAVQAMHIDQTINRVTKATITLIDGDRIKQGFPVSESKSFIPGNEIEIKAGYDGKNEVLFTGIITKQTIRADIESGALLDVECYDKAIKMTVGRKSNVYYQMKDSDVFSSLISNAGLSSQVDSTSITLAELVQYYVSDWDFLISRAEVNGMLVSTENGKVVVFSPDQSSSPVLLLKYGEDLIRFNLSINAASQLASVKASAWDYKNQKVTSAKATNNYYGPGNLSSKKLSQVIGLAEYELQSTAALNNEELDQWAKARMLKSELSKITGNVQCQGTSRIQTGKKVTLSGLGARFNGDHFISSVRHTFADGNWLTDFNVGLSPESLLQQSEAEAAPASGVIPAIQGLFNGIVKQIKNDPENQQRILVEVPLFKDRTGIWARISGDQLTNVKKDLFLPQIGDEVILGFLNQDPRHPVILGSMYKPAKKIKAVRKSTFVK